MLAYATFSIKLAPALGMTLGDAGIRGHVNNGRAKATQAPDNGVKMSATIITLTSTAMYFLANRNNAPNERLIVM